MLKKNTLLTGVVFPLMSLAIAVEPAAAGFAGAARAQTPVSQALPGDAATGQVILAQAQPEEPNPEEELRKRRKQAEEEQPQAEPQRQERAPEPQREPEPKREAAPAEPRPEPQREPQPEPQREPQQREARPEPAPAEQPQERPRKPERAQEPQREAAPEAAPAEEQPKERPRKPERAEQPAGEGEQRPERPRKERAKEPAAEQEPAARPENAGEPAKPREPAPSKKPPVEEKAPEQKAEPAEKAVPEKKPAAPEPAAKEAPVPTEAPTPARPPAPEAQPNPAPGRQPSEQPPVEGQGRTEPAAPLPGAPTPPPSGTTTGQAPAGEPVPNQVAVPQTEAPPMTKEDLDKAKAIAKDPSKTADTVILPVDKGAAVLDSDKEVERSGNRQTREERRREREQAGDVKVPTSDAEAQRAGAAEGKAPPPPVKMEAITSQQGERVDRRPQYERPEGVREWQPREGRPRDRDRDEPGHAQPQGARRILVRHADPGQSALAPQCGALQASRRNRAAHRRRQKGTRIMTSTDQSGVELPIDVERIAAMLPHRYPFLLIDRVIAFEHGKRLTAIKNVSINEPFFQGHWPGQPILPGVVQVEALAQLAGVLLLRRLLNTAKVAVLLSIDRIKFRRPVTPGDQLRLECETQSIRAKSAKVHGRASVNNELTCEAVMKFMLMDA